MTYALRTPSGILAGLDGSTPAAVRPLGAAASAQFNGAVADGSVWRPTGDVPESRRPTYLREAVPVAYLTRDGSSGPFTSYDRDGAVVRDPPGGLGSATREWWSAGAPPNAPRAPRPLTVATLAASYVGQSLVAFDAGASRWLPAVVVSDGDAVLMPVGAPVPAVLPASTPAAAVVDSQDDATAARSFRVFLPVAYLTRDGSSGPFTSYDRDGAVVRDPPGGLGSATREWWSAGAPPNAPRAPRPLTVATLAASYVGQSLVAFDAGASRWLPAVVVSDGDAVLMPVGAPVPAVLPASTPAAAVVDSQDDATAARSFRVFRRTGAGGLVLGRVDTSRDPDARPTEASAVTAPPSTLGAFAGTARDGRLVAVNVSGSGDGAAWALLRWA